MQYGRLSAVVEELRVKVHNNGPSFRQVGLDRRQKTIFGRFNSS